MFGSGIVVEFPTGRPFVPKPLCGPGNRSVAGIVRRLSGIRGKRRGAEPDTHVTIGLRDLAGVGDETIDRLSVLVRGGVVTPASAARLALRHADECSGQKPLRGPPGGGAATYELTVAGDPFGRFALRLQGRTGWLVFAPATSLGCLAELCSCGRIQACLLIGCSADRRTTVQLLDSASWRRRLAVLGADIGRCGSRHVLLLGGLPLRDPERSWALAELERAVRRSGNTVISASLRKSLDTQGRPPLPEPARELLTMIELAYPGLVDASAPDEGPAP
ncbi:hypothetical protein H0176_22095 [Methylorubrum populi]|uniref:Uncharacterized protein n=1 Tax=Methylorubrum rhodesianum TaxID=29427 RepID=A0ABU9ZGV8_9HYPH|nr:hypothetical protein [Methylorubrum rhodesianum]MBK3404153.1 hypothetical protein [Methylorubrum rhodesianum]MBY0142943.1 hypothetical protein [Methylorubrum populi]